MQTYQTDLKDEFVQMMTDADYGYSHKEIADWWIKRLQAREEWLREIYERLEEHRTKRHNGEDDYGELCSITDDVLSLISQKK